MAEYIIQAQITPPPFPLSRASVYIAENPTDSYVLRRDLELESMHIAIAGQDIGSCTLRRRYGQVKYPHLPGYLTSTPIDWTGYWVQVVSVTPNGPVLTFVGRIYDTPQTIFADGGIAGVQRFVAYEPAHLLNRISISDSYFQKEERAIRVGWGPGFNDRAGRGWVIGNRSPNEIDGSYVFVGVNEFEPANEERIWTRLNMAEYIVQKFVDETESNGLKWRVTGQTDMLDMIKDNVPNNPGTAYERLQQIINPSIGMDWKVEPKTAGDFEVGAGYPIEGFDIEVFSLLAEDVTFAGVTIPKNEDTIKLNPAGSKTIQEMRIERSASHTYNQIRVIGNRMVICASLDAGTSDLEERWGTDLESDYIAGDPDDPGAPNADHDIWRQQEKFRNVFQLYGAPRIDWGQDSFFPKLNDEGEIDLGAGRADAQHLVRSTLSFLPLQEGVDYKAEPLEDFGDDVADPDFLPPAVYLYDLEEERYIAAEHAGIHVHVLQNDLGVWLQADPNHVLDGDTTVENSELQEGRYDSAQMVCTLAWESDQRFEMRSYLEGSYADNDDPPSEGVLHIEVPGAELWYVAPETVLRVDNDGTLVKTGSEPLVLRNDADRLALAMAGAIARYQSERGRASIEIKGWIAQRLYLGKILTFINAGDEAQAINGPVTSIHWQVPESKSTRNAPQPLSPSVTLKAGYAL